MPISHQDPPGHQGDMPGKEPVNEHVPTEDGGYQLYKAAGKLEGKKALITGGKYFSPVNNSEAVTVS